MRKKNFSKLILKVSEGLLSRAVDAVLVGVFYFAETAPFSQGSLNQQMNRIGDGLEVTNYESLKRAFYTAQQKGWLNSNLQITKEGQKRLNAFLPQYYKKKKEWNGKWYIVTYDIPEKKRYLRNILRDKLEKLGFAQLQKSIWVSPKNFLGDVEDLVRQYNLTSFVILAVSETLGREPSMELAERIWQIGELNDDYKDFVKQAEAGKLSKKERIFKYLAILKRDPQLPKDLLPADWMDEEAHKIYKKAARKSKKVNSAEG